MLPSPAPGNEVTFRAALREVLPEADGPLLSLRVCLHTNSPDLNFMIGPDPRHPRVLMACEFSGHGFKLACVIGKGLADLAPDHVCSTVSRFVFVLDSRPDEVDSCVSIEATGPPGVLRTVFFARGETDEGLDLVQPIVVEGVLAVIGHPAQGPFPAVVELQV